MATEADVRQEAFEARLAVLRREYLAGLPTRRAALAAAWDACADGGDRAPWEQLRVVAHKLSGSAPSYGFEALGKAARDLDRLLSGRSPCRERTSARALVERLMTALDTVAGNA